MAEHRPDLSPRMLARIGGMLYLVIIVGGLLGETLIRTRLIVPDDAAATAANIRAEETLWRFGIGAEFLMLACTVALALIFFVLLRPVSRDLALLAVLFNLVSVAVEATNELRLVGALVPLDDPEYLSAFGPEQLDAVSSLSVELYGYGFGAGLIFFGCECLVLGYLIFRSDYLPKALGVLMAIAGACYLTNSFALLVAPTVADRLFPTILLPAFVGEASLCLWLLVRGVNGEKWIPPASAPSTRRAGATA